MKILKRLIKKKSVKNEDKIFISLYGPNENGVVW